MYSEYVEKLKVFSELAGGEFKYTNHPTTTLKRMHWSRVEIRIPYRKTDLFFIAFSGTNSAEVYSGFYAAANLQKNLICKITQKDTFLSLINKFSNKKMKSGRSSFDRKLSITCNNKTFLLQLTRNHEVAKFLESNIQFPVQFEVISNEKGFIKSSKQSGMLISINANEWVIDQKMLMGLLDGFKLLVDHIG